MRKWIPALLIGAAFVSSFALLSSFQPQVAVGLSGLLPFAAGGAEQIPRAAVLFGLPSLALLLWALLHEAPVSLLGRATGRLFFNAGEPRYEVFAPSYRLIVIWVVSLVLSVHVAVLAEVLHWNVAPGLIVGLTFGAGLVIVGNILPRLRQNAVAGIRTAKTMSDADAWARVHRTFGAVWVVAGLVTVAASLMAPGYALVVGLAALALSSVAGLAQSR